VCFLFQFPGYAPYSPLPNVPPAYDQYGNPSPYVTQQQQFFQQQQQQFGPYAGYPGYLPQATATTNAAATSAALAER